MLRIRYFINTAIYTVILFRLPIYFIAWCRKSCREVDMHQLKLGNPADQHGVDVEVVDVQHAQLSVNEDDLTIIKIKIYLIWQQRMMVSSIWPSWEYSQSICTWTKTEIWFCYLLSDLYCICMDSIMISAIEVDRWFVKAICCGLARPPSICLLETFQMYETAPR